MTSSYTILLLFKVQIHSTIIFISQDFVYFNYITSNESRLNTITVLEHQNCGIFIEGDVRVGENFISPTTFVRDLGIYLDSDASTRIQMSRISSCCFATLCQVRSISRSVSK